jgi:hypothetical protein
LANTGIAVPSLRVAVTHRIQQDPVESASVGNRVARPYGMYDVAVKGRRRPGRMV